MKKIILASGSPRRKEILSNIGLEYDVVVSDADESKISADKLPPAVYVQELALLKATAAAKSADKNCLIIAADTVVCSDGVIFGKPKNREEAAQMLRTLSGKAHSVFTGICVMRTKDAFSCCSAEETKVYFKELSDGMINGYVESGEPMDKAGAYGIQGLGAILIDKIEGDYFNVVGLPVSRLAEMLWKEFDFDVLKGE